MPKFKVEGENRTFDVYETAPDGRFTVSKGELSLRGNLIEVQAPGETVARVPQFTTLAIITAADKKAA